MRDRIEKTILNTVVCGAVIVSAFIFCYRAAYQRGAMVGVTVASRSWELASTNEAPNATHFAIRERR